jgi:chorismate mutase / prephenate dehydratase
MHAQLAGLQGSKFLSAVSSAAGRIGEEMGLLEYRQQLDEIDAQVVKLIEKRMEISRLVAADKIKSGKKVLDKKREQEKLTTLANMAGSDFNRRAVHELYEQIMAISRKCQYRVMEEEGQLRGLPFIPVDSLIDEHTRVVYQGAPGAYSEAAMKQFFGEEIDNFHVETFRDAMSAIEEGAADYAILPIENSTAGIVSQNYDLLFEFENYIVGEQIIPIRHCLMGVPGTTIETVRRVYSHPQSLMQSEHYLDQHPEWQQVGMQNNAYAAEKVAADQSVEEAAIGSEYAAKAYGLEILEKGINDSDNNSTRFIVVTNRKVFLRSGRKISIVLETEHESGALYRVLSHFIYNNLNMNKIESRPIRDRSFEYRFFIDFDGNMEDPAVRNALRGLRDESKNLKVLGNY